VEWNLLMRLLSRVRVLSYCSMFAAVVVSGDPAVDVTPSMSLKIAPDVKPANAALSASELSLGSAAQMTVEPAVDVTLSADAALFCLLSLFRVRVRSLLRALLGCRWTLRVEWNLMLLLLSLSRLL
jgi:hypothetical protein